VSIVITKDVFCDGRDGDGPCVEWTHGVVSGSNEEARKQAAREGWTRKGTRDLCPRHSLGGSS
jgi:hypothetical protein